MADRDDTAPPEPKSSADLIREARAAAAGGDPEATASEALMDEARSWLEAEVLADAAGEAAMQAVTAEEIDAEYRADEVVFQPPPRPSRPAGAPPAPRPVPQQPTRPQPRPQRTPRPTAPPDPERAARSRRRIGSIAGALIAVAVAGNLVSLVASRVADDTPDAPAVEVVPAGYVSTGVLTSGTDPCTGAELSGDLTLQVTHWPYEDAPEVDTLLTGTLRSTDGHTYTLEGFGSATGGPGQTTFAVTTDYLTTVRDDGTTFEEQADLTLTLEGGEITYWEYQSEGAACPG
ncbi:MAG: hypothetical protein KQH83_01355 [Actinobacteria bacterium]|nr:hypothetical protein [Actinomycetota bacterium]